MARKKAQALPQPEPEMLTVFGDILQETEDAILFRCEADEVWLPKSQIEYVGERGDEYVEVSVPDWLAEDKGLSERQGYIPPSTVAALPVPAEPTQPETVMFFGIRNAEQDTENDINFEVHYSDEANTVAEFFIPKAYIVSEGQDSNYPEEDERRYIEMSVAHAVEVGMVEAHDEASGGSESGASSVPNDRHWLKQETITVRQELSQKEKAEYAEGMALLDDEIEELETERDSVMKSLKKQIDAKEYERRKLSKVVRGRSEEREIFCDKLADYNTCEMVWTDAHPPHDEVKRQKMTAEERQLPLEKKTKPTDVVPTSSDASEGLDFDALTMNAEMEKTCETCVHDGAVDDDGEPCESCNEFLSNWQVKPDDTLARECSNCVNLHQTFSENDADPCHLCSDEAKENWTPMSDANAIAVDGQADTHVDVVQ